MTSSPVRWVVVIAAFVLGVTVLFLPAMLFLAATVPHVSSDLPSPGLLACSLGLSLVLGAYLARLGYCRLERRAFVPQAQRSRFLFIGATAAFAGTLAGVLALAPFVAGENLSGGWFLGYIGLLAAVALGFAAVAVPASRPQNVC